MMVSTLSSVLLVFGQIVVSAIVILSLYIKWNHQYWKRRKLSYLEPSFPLGNISLPYFDKDHLGVQFRKAYQRSKSKGLRHCGIYLFASPAYMPLDLDYVKHVMTKDFQYFTDRGFFHNERDDPLSAHLFTIGGTKWRNLRVKVSPTFTAGKMKQMFQTLLDCEVQLIRAVEVYCQKGQPFDIKDVFARFTTNIISSCAFGLEDDCFQTEDAPLRKYGRILTEMTTLRSSISTFLMSYPHLGRHLRINFTKGDVHNFFMSVVRDAVAYRKKNQVKRNDFLQLLMEMLDEDNNKQDGTTLTMDELAAQCFVFFVGGYETSSTASSFLMYELARHPEYQQKLRDEVLEVLARYEGKVTYEALNEMKYLEQVINEALRMYPPASFLTRECVKDYAVPDSDVILEKGTKVILPVLGIHMDPEYYPQPEEFDPERFNDENKQSRHSYAHLPFGEGPRICIGMRFGMMQLKVGVAALIRNYTFTVNDKTKVPIEYVSTPLFLEAVGGLWLNVEKI